MKTHNNYTFAIFILNFATFVYRHYSNFILYIFASTFWLTFEARQLSNTTSAKYSGMFDKTYLLSCLSIAGMLFLHYTLKCSRQALHYCVELLNSLFLEHSLGSFRWEIHLHGDKPAGFCVRLVPVFSDMCLLS